VAEFYALEQGSPIGVSLNWGAITPEKKGHEGILVLPTIAAMGLAAGGSNIAK
jgi:hypothetical protein